MALYDEDVINQLEKLGADRQLCIEASQLVQNPKDIMCIFWTVSNYSLAVETIRNEILDQFINGSLSMDV